MNHRTLLNLICNIFFSYKSDLFLFRYGDSSGPDGGGGGGGVARPRNQNQGSPNRSRYAPSTPVGGSSRYGGPPTPNSAHSRQTRTPDHRRDARGSSSDRFGKFFTPSIPFSFPPKKVCRCHDYRISTGMYFPNLVILPT